MKQDKPIIESLTDADFYKWLMGQMIFHKHPKVPTIFSFINRTSSIRLAEIIDVGRLREELEHCRTLMYSTQELHYILGTYEYEQPMFKLDYINFMKNFKLSNFLLKVHDGQFDLKFYGDWSVNTHWETLSMSIINEMYYEAQMKQLTRFDREVIEANGRIRLAKKVRELEKHPEVTFSDFGTRRRFCRKWQDYVVGVLTEELPEQFRGTSNVFLAKKYGLMPMGTNAHELPMTYSGIYFNEDEEKGPAFSQSKVLRDWEAEYGLGLSLFLPDTYRSDWFFNEAVSPRMHRMWKGSRQDSGDPLEYAKKRIKEYEDMGIDPLKKMIVFADGLNVEKMIAISEACQGKIQYSFGKINYTFGWGTDLTNDLGFKPLSIVTKVVSSNGHPVAKLSDNIEKATGPKEAIDRMKRLVGYTTTFSEKCEF